jgi:hypothetical protein
VRLIHDRCDKSLTEFNFKCWDRSVCKATGYYLDGWGSIPGRVKRLFCTPLSRMVLGPTQSPIKSTVGALSPG